MGAAAVTSALAVAAIACAPSALPRFPAKPAGCRLETVGTLPQRPFIELETFDLPSSPESMRDILDIVQDRACRDGADAVYAPKGGRTYTYAIAVKWNDPPPPPPPAPPPPPPAAEPAPPQPAEPPAPPPPAEPPAA